MNLYIVCVGLHLLAMSLWLGHMFVWSLVTGPALKGLQPAEKAELLRERSMYRGGLGWPALAVLVPTGVYLLAHRGVAPADLISAATYAGSQGTVLGVKLALILFMIGYQLIFAHRRAPIAIYFNMLAALGVLAASVLLVRGWVR